MENVQKLQTQRAEQPSDSGGPEKSMQLHDCPLLVQVSPNWELLNVNTGAEPLFPVQWNNHVND
ncbi:hypothetical protein NCCP2716_06010 [Sporosarcina sp. NCCP-2716]|nr:hypothetical protein NCCP2716_06010 [Sporosarcina sp. NCCP-2716]